mgnify:CR=1 FL=1
MLRLGEIVNDVMSMVSEFLQSESVSALFFYDSDSRGIILRSPPGGAKVFDGVVLSMLRDWLWNIRSDWDVRIGFIDEYRVMYRRMSGGEFLNWLARSKLSVRDDILSLVKQDSEVEWYKIVAFNTSDKSIIYYDEFIIKNRPKPVRTSWRPGRLAISLPTSILAAAALDYLVITKGLVVIPPIGFFLHPGLGLLNLIEAGAVSALLLAIGLWQGGFNPRRAALMALSSLGALSFVGWGVLLKAIVLGDATRIVITFLTLLFSFITAYGLIGYIEEGGS